jgi:hypothetical protein
VNNVSNISSIHYSCSARLWFAKRQRFFKTVPDDSQESCVLSLQKFPKSLRKRLKMKAAEREIDLKDLCAEYLATALDADQSERPSKAKR